MEGKLHYLVFKINSKTRPRQSVSHSRSKILGLNWKKRRENWKKTGRKGKKMERNGEKKTRKIGRNQNILKETKKWEEMGRT